MLRSQGYQVASARDGREALAVCEAQGRPVHLVVTDIVMPNMGGRELMQNVRRIYPEAGIILMSGYTDDLLVQQDVQTTNACFLQKPFSPADLLAKVREALGREETSRVARAAVGADQA